MKTKTFLALFCLLCISSGFSSCQRHSSDQWKLVWEDNFDQKTGFDPQVWSKIQRGKSLHSISMTHILSPIPASKQTKKGSFLSTSLSIY